jgi:enoyl ACP reductase
MKLLENKKFLITGVLTNTSIAYSCADQVIKHGGTIVLSSFGKAKRLTDKMASRLAKANDLEEIPVIELDVTNEDDLNACIDRLKSVGFDHLDGALHAIAFASQNCLGGDFLNSPKSEILQAFEISTYSYAGLTKAVLPILTPGSCVVGLDFDATVSWPGYDWMGVCKAGLESVNRYLARDCGPKGVRVNLIAAGPLKTMAAKNIPGFEKFEEVWETRSPIGWDLTDPNPVGKTCVALFSDLMPSTTGEMIHVDGGYHSTGA